MTTEFSFEPLTPTSFLNRAGTVYADRVALIEGEERYTYAQLLERAQRLAGALAALGVEPGERVAVLAPNTHAMLEAHFGVPFAGAVLLTLNTRLTAAELAYILEHSAARLLIYDHELEAVARETAALLSAAPRLIRSGTGADEYERLLDDAPRLAHAVTDERGLLALDYTSGTTGKPKGVMYHHRGAYLQALAMALQTGLNGDSRYLWTLPMFHCNGWCFPWAVTAIGGTHVCLRRVDPGAIWQHLRYSGITHLCAAPTVVTMLAWHEGAKQGRLPRPVRIATGGSPPTPALLARMGELGLDMMHLYGLTETYGPSVICDWRSEWNALPLEQQARLKARQGVANVISQPVRVIDDNGADVPADGATLGEIALRGNNLMLGYYLDQEATRKACPDRWFRTGDVGVMHPDGYIELKDRSKDVIISGGESIASVEVEQALATHPAVLESAVVAAPDEKWGEVPVAFVALKEGASASADELAEGLHGVLARFKVPKKFVFGELPKTATGKIQKFMLREKAKSL
jgi:acyl-CoA synthetase (AMP-forming)/AMP-acid ligase II